MEPIAYAEMAANEGQHWWYRGMRDITAAILAQNLPRQTELRILDAGCGTGANMTALSQFGKVWGIDYSSIALDYSQEAHPHKLARATVEKLPYADDTFDLVVSFEVLNCYEIGDDVVALREFQRVVKPGGYVLVRLPALRQLGGHHDDMVHGIRRYTASEIRGKLQAAGMQPVRVTYANTLLLPAVFAARQLQNLRRHAPTEEAKSDVQPVSEPWNSILMGVIGLERRWIAQQHNLPLGVSVMALAVK